MTRVFVVVGAAVSTLVVLAACGSSVVPGSPASSGGSSSPSTVATTPSKPAPDLKAQLLTVAGMPSGWAVDNSSDDSGGGAPPCVKNLKSSTDAPAKAQADFVKGSDIPTFSQQIGYFGTPATATEKFSIIKATLDACKDLSFTSDGHHFKGTIGAMSFPKLGDRSGAWSITESAEGVDVGIYVVFVQKGAEIEDLLYADLGTPDLDEYTTLVNAAVAKMP